MPRSLVWDLVDYGVWEAASSKYHPLEHLDGGAPFKYRIVVNELGLFEIDSDEELCPSDKKFDTFAKAKMHIHGQNLAVIRSIHLAMKREHATPLEIE